MKYYNINELRKNGKFGIILKEVKTMAVGFIFEANPYHFGHRFLIKKAQELYPNDPLVMVTSTSFTMRGETSQIGRAHV